ncbi:hypothetical protein [Rhodococcus erythropolis]
MPLDGIRELLTAAANDARPQLRHQRIQLTQQISHMESMVASVLM